MEIFHCVQRCVTLFNLSGAVPRWSSDRFSVTSLLKSCSVSSATVKRKEEKWKQCLCTLLLPNNWGLLHTLFSSLKYICVCVCVCVCACICVHVHVRERVHACACMCVYLGWTGIPEHWYTYLYGNIHKRFSSYLAHCPPSKALYTHVTAPVTGWCCCF